MVKYLALIFCVLGFPLPAQSIDLEEALDELMDKALQLNITAKVLPPGEQPVWNSKSSNVTIPGRSVAVRLVGENIRIDVIFTPYQKKDGALFLLAQGQVWLSEVEEETRYLTTFESIPVSVGEKVLFFPLGLEGEIPEIPDRKTFNIQLEVEIFPYKQLLEASSQ